MILTVQEQKTILRLMSPKLKSRFFLPLILVLIILTAFLFKSQLGIRIPLKEKIIVPTPTPIWNTHKDFKYGHQIEYPPDWTKEEWEITQAANLKTIPDGYIWHQLKLTKGNDYRFEVVIWANKARAPLLTWLRWYRHEDLSLDKLPKEPNFKFLEIPAIILFEGKERHENPVVRIIFPKEDKIFELIIQSQTETLTPINQKIIDSFQFL